MSININKWYPVPGYSAVEVNAQGDIKPYIPQIEADGQRWVHIHADGKYTKVRLAELVLAAFGIEVPEGQHIRYYGSRIDCRLANIYFSDEPEPEPAKYMPTGHLSFNTKRERRPIF